jgi:hypothetical protein
MTDKTTRDELLASAKKVATDVSKAETIGEVLAIIAGGPFRDDHNADYALNAVIASGTAEQLKAAYGLTDAAAHALHGYAQVNVHTKQRPGKIKGTSAIAEVLKDMLEKSIPGKDGKPVMAFKFKSATEEEARALSQQVERRIKAGESPLDVIKELGGTMMTAEEMAEAEKQGEESTQLDLTPKADEDPITAALAKAFSDMGIKANVGKAVEIKGSKAEINAKLGEAIAELFSEKDRSCSNPDCPACKLGRATAEGIKQGLFTTEELDAATDADDEFTDRLIKQVLDGADPLTAVKDGLSAFRH